MKLDAKSFIDFYNKFRPLNFSKCFFVPEETKLQAVIYNDGDFVKAEVGECDSDQVPFVLDVSLLSSALKSAQNEQLAIKVKNSKAQFSTEDKKFKFVLEALTAENLKINNIGKDCDEFEYPVDPWTAACEFTTSLYPLNHVYFGKNNTGVFACSGDRIFSTIGFKDPWFGVIRANAKIMKNISSPTVKYCSESSILWHSDDFRSMKCKVINPDIKKLKPYIDLVSEPSTYISVVISALQEALAPHINTTSDEVKIQFTEGQGTVSSSIGDKMAVKTFFECPGDFAHEFTFAPRELNLVTTFMSKYGDTVNMAVHDKHSNIFIVLNDKYFFATT